MILSGVKEEEALKRYYSVFWFREQVNSGQMHTLLVGKSIGVKNREPF